MKKNNVENKSNLLYIKKLLEIYFNPDMVDIITGTENVSNILGSNQLIFSKKRVKMNLWHNEYKDYYSATICFKGECVTINGSYTEIFHKLENFIYKDDAECEKIRENINNSIWVSPEEAKINQIEVKNPIAHLIDTRTDTTIPVYKRINLFNRFFFKLLGIKYIKKDGSKTEKRH